MAPAPPYSEGDPRCAEEGYLVAPPFEVPTDLGQVVLGTEAVVVGCGRIRCSSWGDALSSRTWSTD